MWGGEGGKKLYYVRMYGKQKPLSSKRNVGGGRRREKKESEERFIAPSPPVPCTTYVYPVSGTDHVYYNLLS